MRSFSFVSLDHFAHCIGFSRFCYLFFRCLVLRCGLVFLALNKKSGGIRPIVVGFTLRRLASKCANSVGIGRLKSYFQPSSESALQADVRQRSMQLAAT